jgi:hypothetical protein
VELRDYCEEVRKYGWQCSERALQRFVNVGHVFRLLASIDWASHNLRYGWNEAHRANLAKYQERLRAALLELDLGGQG